MSKGTWDIGVVKVIKREKQAGALAMGRKCRKQWSGKFIRGPALKPQGVTVETK
jgi:ribulose bisphosphate carboxylase small subunit